MTLSFFAKESFLRENKEENSGLYLQRVSSIIRAKKIAKFLCAKYNPKEGYENDLCIHVKPVNLNHVKDGDFVDVLDDLKITEAIKDKPSIKVITMSGPHYEWLRSILKNKIVLIPHHHVNFERVKRKRGKILNCGYVGSYRAYHIQIIGHFRHIAKSPQYHATKIVNAMSFGIPTVAGPKLGYKDVEGYYLQAHNLDELVKVTKKLKDPKYYNEWAEKI